MEHRQMYAEPGITELNDLKEAKDCPHPKVRFVLHSKRLKKMPDVKEAAHIPYVQFDLGYNEALDHASAIDELAVLPHLKGLGMTKTKMSKLPDSIGGLTGLEALEITGNQLKELPDSIQSLKELRILNLRTNRFTTFPKNLAGMLKLEELSLRFNEIKTLPKEIAAFPALQLLDLSSNSIAVLPPAIKELSRLKELHIKYNKLTRLPDELGELQELEVVALNGNKGLDFDQAFRVLANCKKLKRLRLKGCGLKSLPDSIVLLEGLESIDLQDNYFDELPEILLQLKHLREIMSPNPLPMPFFINMIKDNPECTTFSTSNLLPYVHNGKKTLPDEITQLRHVTMMCLYDLEVLPASLAQMTWVRTLDVHGEALQDCPDLSSLTVLEALFLSGVTLPQLPDWVYRLPNLRKLMLPESILTVDFARLAQLPQLEELSVPAITEENTRLLKQAPCLRRLCFPHGTPQLPDAFFELPFVDTFDFDDYRAVEPNTITPQLKRLPSLKSVDFGTREQPFDWYIACLKDLPALKEATFYADSLQLPESLLELSHLDRLNIHFTQDALYGRNWVEKKPEIPLALGRAKGGQIVLEDRGPLKPYRAAFAQLATMDVQDGRRREIIFGLLAHQYEALHALLPYPFDAAGNIPGAKIYVAGTPTLGDKKSLAKLLQNRDADIVKDVKEATHLFLGQNIPEDTVSGLFRQDYQYILEDHLKAQEIKDDTPFLMTEENQELTEQITRLLADQHTNNIELVLQMIEGGGAGKVLLSYLAAIHLFHTDLVIRKQSRTLFRKYASATLQHHLKSSWEARFKDRPEDDCRVLYLHPELDACAFVLAFQMVKRQEAKGYRVNSLVLRDMPASDISDVLAHFQHVRSVNLDLGETTDLPRLVDYLRQLPLTDLSVRITTDEIPASLFTLPVELHVGRKHDRELTIPDLTGVEVRLKKFWMAYVPLKHTERLAACRELTYLSLEFCEIPDMTFVTEMKNLVIAELQGNRFTHIPAALNQLQQLEKLRLDYNPFPPGCFDFTQLKKLEDLRLPNA
ncbi:leucine-rich repeat domain-containing protein [Chitinophaga sp. G-6-1-13]|uniref:Leucine-rich repeat domain-containing protein n=1 Tax=Chitinophaga fulva TaxID=2728842 RepID=A0A848GS08_9BACT|nr:leucine-rich repeat domain-containing protein [Chitinophaga fulva]NML41184.1 leucine-rich repeat domain-containing protein [Chitinophaga fulva]